MLERVFWTCIFPNLYCWLKSVSMVQEQPRVYERTATWRRLGWFGNLQTSAWPLQTTTSPPSWWKTANLSFQNQHILNVTTHWNAWSVAADRQRFSPEPVHGPSFANTRVLQRRWHQRWWSHNLQLKSVAFAHSISPVTCIPGDMGRDTAAVIRLIWRVWYHLGRTVDIRTSSALLFNQVSNCKVVCYLNHLTQSSSCF